MAKRNINKYYNKKTIIDNIKFDSKKEAKRYTELKLLEKAKQIFNLELQPKFLLTDTIRLKNETLSKMYYIADFKYLDKNGNIIVEDVKGYKTTEYQIKKKIFLSKYSDELNFKEI